MEFPVLITATVTLLTFVANVGFGKSNSLKTTDTICAFSH